MKQEKAYTRKNRELDMDELEYSEYWCGKLTEAQKSVIKQKKEENQFIGVGRFPGEMNYYPMILINGNFKLVDKKGNYYCQQPALTGQKTY
ncbi:hypothetical protein M0R19_06225 [Candidatus Pacearchaeota archaeon]|jgi:hypothetical protein|nr:hypothetical protein [Candidatus Pacearchaeota archaeon]